MKQSNKINFTHFFSIPLNKPQVKQLFNEIRKKINILQETKSNTMHLTLFLLELQDQEQQLKTVQIFQKFENLIQSLGPINLKPSKINFFGKNQKKAKALYLEFEEDSNIKNINFITYCLLTECFENGLIKIKEGSNEILKQHMIIDKENQTVHRKLHLTLKSSSNNKMMNLQPYMQFIKSIQFNKDFSIQVDQIHLSTRFKFEENGFYLPLHLINMNTNQNLNKELLKEERQNELQETETSTFQFFSFSVSNENFPKYQKKQKQTKQLDIQNQKQISQAVIKEKEDQIIQSQLQVQISGNQEQNESLQLDLLISSDQEILDQKQKQTFLSIQQIQKNEEEQIGAETQKYAVNQSESNSQKEVLEIKNTTQLII